MKISETGWENMRTESAKCIQLLDAKISTIKDEFLLNKKIKFVSDLKNVDITNYGKLAVSKNSSNSVTLRS